MTKTLTELWRDGTLPDNTYYWKVCKEDLIADKYEMYDYTKVYDVNKIKCLEPVPVYNVWKNIHEQWKVAIPQIERLKKRLDIAKKALNDILNDGDDYWDKDKANEALTKMEGVK